MKTDNTWGRLCFGVFYAVAILRALRYRFPRLAPLPKLHTGVSCSFHRPGECWQMYLHGWKPWCISPTVPHGQFAVEMSSEEKAIDAAWLSQTQVQSSLGFNNH